MAIVLIILAVLVVVALGILLQGRSGPRQHDPLAGDGSVRMSPEERQDHSSHLADGSPAGVAESEAPDPSQS